MRVAFAEGFHEDLARITRHLVSHGAQVEARIAEIFEALRILKRNPYIGHEVEDGLRELVIGDRRKNRGYVALYDVYEESGGDSEQDVEDGGKGLVIVNAIRSRHESGYH